MSQIDKPITDTVKENSSNTLQAFWVSTGSLFTYSFAFVSAMILSRYFVKEDYGTYKQVLYVYATLLAVFTLGLPKAFSFFLPRVPLDEAKTLIKKLTNLFFLLGSVFSVILFLFARQIATFLQNSDLELALKIFSPVPLLMLPTMGLEGILSTYRKLKFLTIYKIATGLMQLLCVVLPVILFKFGYIQAIIGFLTSSFFAFLLALFFQYMPVKNAGNKKTQITYNEVIRFSLPLMYASLWGMIIAAADQFFISRYFGKAVFAEFANGSLELPFVGMIVGACATVLSPVFSRLNHEKVDPKAEIFPIWKSVFEKTAILTYPLLLYCWFFADVLIVVFFGEMYENSSIYFRIKSLINFLNLIVFAPLIISIGKTKFYANVHMVTAICLISFEYLSIQIFNSPYAIAVISLVCQIGKIFALLLFNAKFFGLPLYKLFPLKLLLKLILPSVLILMLLHYSFVDLWVMNKLLILCFSFLIYFVVFFFLSFPLKIEYLSVVNPLIHKFLNKNNT